MQMLRMGTDLAVVVPALGLRCVALRPFWYRPFLDVRNAMFRTRCEDREKQRRHAGSGLQRIAEAR